MSEEDFEYGDYDMLEDYVAVPTSQALPYPDVEQQDDPDSPEALAFVGGGGRTPEQAIATARDWSRRGLYFGIGRCLAVVRRYYNVPSKYGTAALSWEHAEHKHFSNDGNDAPRGAPVYWTGGSRGAGHIAISVGGGMCLSTDWARLGKIDYASINDITSHWALDYKGWSREVNDVVVWEPALKAPAGDIHLHNVKWHDKNSDVLKLKKRLKEKGYSGFIVNSPKFGIGTKRAYAKFQRRLGFKGNDANGIPGKTSLQKLGFRVLP